MIPPRKIILLDKFPQEDGTIKCNILVRGTHITDTVWLTQDWFFGPGFMKAETKIFIAAVLNRRQYIAAQGSNVAGVKV